MDQEGIFKVKIIIGRRDNSIYFINSDNGIELDPIAILQELQAGDLKLHIDVQAHPITTRMRAFGATVEGHLEVVGHRNTIEIYLGPIEKKDASK